MVRPKKPISHPVALSDPTPELASIDELLTQRAQQDVLRFVTCGNAHTGKSTLIGRLLWESRQVLDDQLSALQTDSKRYGAEGKDVDFALLMDGLIAERESGGTVDVANRFFSTPRRRFVAADTPGREQYTRNMLTGASTAEVAVLLIDARQGILTQTRRHAYLVSLVGIRYVVLAINKMDLVNYQQVVFDAIVTEFALLAKSLGFHEFTPIPVSALKGENITKRSVQTSWYAGPTLMGCLEAITAEHPKSSKTAFPVQWVNRPTVNFTGFSGTLSSGQLRLGDQLRVTSSGHTAKLSNIVTANGNVDTVHAGESVTLVLDREVDASRGDIIALADEPLEMTDQFEATLVWMHDEPGHVGRSYELRLANQWGSASITKLKYRVDMNTQAHESCQQLLLNDIAVVNIALSKPAVFASYNEDKTLGSFILIDRFTHSTVAAGVVRHNLRRAQNVHRQALSIMREDRERLNGHHGKVIWFTGLSGSGKSTVANALEKELHAQGKRTYILDGDNIRQGLSKDLGFTDADRVENIRRIAEVAKLMMDAGLIVMTAFISPFRAEREMARELIGAEHFIEVFVDTPLEVCEQRDPKGLYKKARSGQLPNMTGISSPYEAPLNPACVLSHAGQNIEGAIRALMGLLEP